jgi:hypothetical protein
MDLDLLYSLYVNLKFRKLPKHGFQVLQELWILEVKLKKYFIKTILSHLSLAQNPTQKIRKITNTLSLMCLKLVEPS